MLSLYWRIWWFCNRKPNKPIVTYFAIVMPWFILGFVLMGGFVIIGFKEIPIWVGLLLIAFAITFGVLGFTIDLKEKYIDAIHNNYSRRRKEKAERLGKKI